MPRLALPELPLVKKELVGLLRTKRAFWFLIAAVAASSLLSLAAWPSSASGVAESQRVVAAAGTFLLAQLTAALVIVPAFAAGAISGERERGTYEVLLATPLSPASIVLSKALAAAGYVVLLLAALAPGIILIHLLGGVTFGSIIRCLAVTLAAVVLSTFICLWASMRAERTSRAIVIGVGGVILWNGGVYWLLSLILMMSPAWMAAGFLASLNYAFSPHLVVALEVFGGTSFVAAASWSEAWLVHVAFASALSACYLLLLLRRAGSPEPSLGRGHAAAARVATGPGTPRRRPFLTSFLLDLGHDDGPLGNPVFRKEIQTEFFGHLSYRRRRFWALFLVFGAVVIFAELPGQDRTMVIAELAIFLVVLLAPGVAASAFPREIEHGNLDFLRGTLIPLREVLRGKFLASLYASFGMISAAGWWIGIGSLGRPMEDVMVVAPLLGFGVLVTAWVFVTAVATLVSVVSSRTTTALLGSYCVVFAWFFALPAVLALLGLDLSVWVAVHPAGALVSLSHQRLWHGGALMCFFLVHAGSIFLILRASGRAVERLRERDP